MRMDVTARERAAWERAAWERVAWERPHQAMGLR